MKTQLKKDEEIILLTRPHWFSLVGPCMITLIMIATGIAIGGYAILAGLFGVCYFVYKVIERANNLWAVTNLRVIDEFGVFSNNSKESPLDKINNVSYSQSLWGRIWGFGNVQIQTAAEIGSTTYYAVEKPKELKDAITHMQEEYKSNQIRKQAVELGRAMGANQNSKIDAVTELERLHELKLKGILTEEEYNARKKKILDS